MVNIAIGPCCNALPGCCCCSKRRFTAKMGSKWLSFLSWAKLLILTTNWMKFHARNQHARAIAYPCKHRFALPVTATNDAHQRHCAHLGLSVASADIARQHLQQRLRTARQSNTTTWRVWHNLLSQGDRQTETDQLLIEACEAAWLHTALQLASRSV